jgi:ATP-dependent DNA helicase RecG
MSPQRTPRTRHGAGPAASVGQREIQTQNWTQATLLGPLASQPYNPDIANTFFRAGEIEAWGRGIERVLLLVRADSRISTRILAERIGVSTPAMDKTLAKLEGPRHAAPGRPCARRTLGGSGGPR